MVTFLMVLIVLAIVLSWFYKLMVPSSKHWKYGNKIPGPKPLPIIGNGLEFLQTKTILGKMAELRRSYGSVYRLWLGKQLFVVLSNPDDIETFLSSTRNLNKSDSYRLLDSWLGNKGLLTCDADVWRVHRKLLTPSFHFKILENSTSMIQKNARMLCEQLQHQVNGPEFNIQTFIEKCSLDIICETAMGTKLETQTSNNTIYLDALKKVCSAAVNRMFKPWLHFEFIFKLTEGGRTYYEMVSIVKKTDKKVIIERKNALEKENAEAAGRIDEKGSKKLKPFLDFMLSESNFTDQEIEDEVQNFMFAGHDTTTAAISFCLYELSKNQHVQDKLVEEINTVLLNLDTELTYHDYINMKFMDNVVKETLRKYPSAPIIARKVDEDFQLPSGYVLPAKSLANFFLIGMHNDEKYFPDPEKFQPERFENNDRHPYSYVPFSAGSRNCIGQKFALLEIKVILTTLLLKYRFLPTTKIKSLTLETGVVLRSLEKVPLKIVLRQL